ncbi:MAG: substrate-binding domain-containing protein, partial [Anaerolineaceae bacterium]|nr:substrate-binding domain-containing protein [Anaerolineaceae bacterium]
MSILLRHQRILEILREEGSVEVAFLAERLGVTGATIRSDLRKLEKENYIRRYHGGAILNEDALDSENLTEQRKKAIARYAAQLLQNGNSVLFDASTTVLYTARYLQHLRNLTIFTNGISVAQELAKNTSNKVVLLGGVMSPSGEAVHGDLGSSLVEGLIIHKAIVSCNGFTFNAGLTTTEVDEAKAIQRRINMAEQVIALIDSSKIGQESVAPFATLKQISMVITDDGIRPEMIPSFKQHGIDLVVVGKNTSTCYYHEEQKHPLRIGFANLDSSSPFPMDVLKSLERASKEHHVELLVRDNQLDSEIAMKNAEELIDQHIDLMIEYHIDEKVGAVLMDKFNRRKIPVISVDIPMVGATFFGVDNYNAGMMAGRVLGDWIMGAWGGHFDRLLIIEEPRGGTLTASRIYGQLDGLQKILGKVPESKRIYLNGGNRADISEETVREVLNLNPEFHRFAVIVFNDDSALGAITAARALGRENEVVIVGQGADVIIR